MVKSARGKTLTCFKRISSKLELAGMEGCDEELGIATFGWSDNSDNAWSASWRIIVRNMQGEFVNRIWDHTCISGESALGFLGAEGECCTWWNQKGMMPNSESWKNLNTCWVSRIIPEWWVMEEEVCAENLLPLQIDVQGYLNHKTKVWSAFWIR